MASSSTRRKLARGRVVKVEALGKGTGAMLNRYGPGHFSHAGRWHRGTTDWTECRYCRRSTLTQEDRR
jgi:hypothetical protein